MDEHSASGLGRLPGVIDSDSMRWSRSKSTPDVIDQRAAAPRVGSPFPGGRAGIGGGLGIVGLLVFLALQLLGGAGGTGFDVGREFGDPAQAPDAGSDAAIPADKDPERDIKDFSAYVFTDVQQTWESTFAQQGKPYERAKLVLYRDAVSTGCGDASSAVGPFYCPADKRVYLDLGFYRDMASQLGAPGDFAWAYVIAHEVGHHAQQQLGTSSEVRRLSAQQPEDANALSVRLELQADCYAGVWAHTVYKAGDLEGGDVDEAVTASAAVGDDRLQSRHGGSVDPDSFTHGTSDQRSDWFTKGEESGQPAECDTFSAEDL
jgi:predicted metalloprotease